MLLQDVPTTDLVNYEFRLQLEATQQITRELDEAQDMILLIYQQSNSGNTVLLQQIDDTYRTTTTKR